MSGAGYGTYVAAENIKSGTVVAIRDGKVYNLEVIHKYRYYDVFTCGLSEGKSTWRWEDVTCLECLKVAIKNDRKTPSRQLKKQLLLERKTRARQQSK